jgi:hypothetical protein
MNQRYKLLAVVRTSDRIRRSTTKVLQGILRPGHHGVVTVEISSPHAVSSSAAIASAALGRIGGVRGVPAGR